MSRVSVIIPNYNHAQYLKQRIDSVLNQSYGDFELIILDDSSTDNSREIIETYRGHQKVSHLIFNETNSGSTFKQWEKGIALAIGQYIWIAESDDWCESTLLQTLVDGLERNKQTVLAYVQSYVIRGECNIDWVSSSNKLIECLEGKTYVKQYLAKSNSIINAGMAVFKRECYFNISPAYNTFKYCGDWLFWVEIALQGDVFISGKALNYFRKHDKDVTGAMYASGNNFKEEIRLLKILRCRSLINEAQFKTYLLHQYIRYLVFKHQYSDATLGEIQAAFFYEGETSYKSFLIWQGRVSLLKIKLKRRLQLKTGPSALKPIPQ